MNIDYLTKEIQEIPKEKKHVSKIEKIVRKHFGRINREGMGFLETNMANCIRELERI